MTPPDSHVPNLVASFRGATALVTGGAGFIGSHLTRALLDLGARVRVLDDLSSGHADNVPAGADFRRASILDADALGHAIEGCRYVFHEAAMVSVPISVEQPQRCMEVNVRGTQGVLDAARHAGVQRMVFAASAAAYGNEPRLPSREDDPIDCWSPYAASKVAGEMLLTTYARCYGLSTVSLRYFNVFGPRQDPKSPYAAAISAFADALRASRRPKVFGDGEQTRDFVSIENIVHANLLAACCERQLRGEVINIGTGERVSLLRVIGAMAEVLSVRSEPEFHPPRSGDVRHSCASIDRARSLLGYKPTTTFADGIRRTLKWFASAHA